MCPEENEKIRKTLDKSGLASTGASEMAFFISSKDDFSLGVYLISLSFSSMLVIYLTISAKATMNHLIKFTFPKKD